MSEKKVVKHKGGRRIIYKVDVSLTKEGSPHTYVILKGVIAVPTVLAKHLTRKEMFLFLKHRGLVGVNSACEFDFPSFKTGK